MADKTKNCGKGQLTSTDAKELYEAFMRNYEETMEEVGKQIDACLEETFQDRISSTISDKEECFDEDAAYENYDVGEFEPIDRMEKERAEQYVGKFMANAGFTARYGRHVGISEDIHERVTKFVSIVGKGKISIASYVDNIINEHFNAYAAEIKAAFDEGLVPADRRLFARGTGGRAQGLCDMDSDEDLFSQRRSDSEGPSGKGTGCMYHREESNH